MTEETTDTGVRQGQEGRGENQRAALRRQQILDAAEACFRLHGFHAASMAEIAKSFGMSAGNIYRFFDSKEAIILALIDRDMDEILDRINQLENEGDVIESVLKGMEECISDRSGRGLLDLEILAEASRNPTVAEKIRRNDALARERLREALFGKAVAGGRRASRDEAARIEVLIAMFDGVTVRGLRNPDIDVAAMARVLHGVVSHVLER